LRAELQAVGGRVAVGDERLVRGGEEAARRDERWRDEPDLGLRRVDTGDRVRGALDVRLRRVHDLLHELLRRRDRAPEVARLGGEALPRRGRVEEAAAEAAASAAPERAGALVRARGRAGRGSLGLAALLEAGA